MAKLTKNNPNPRPSGGNIPNSGGAKTGNPTLIVGVILAALVGLLFFIFSSGLQSKTSIMVAASDIPPFTTLTDRQLEVQSVPTDSVDPNQVLTQERYVKEGKAINRITILKGQRIPIAALSNPKLASFSVVGSGETVVAVSTTVNGLAGGIITPGSVVNVYGGGDAGAALVQKAKVLAVGTGSSAANDIQPNNKVQSSSSDLVVLLVVNNDDAGKLLAASQVSMSYNPHLTFNSKGDICTVGSSSCVTASTTTSEDSTANDSSSTQATPSTSTSGG